MTTDTERRRAEVLARAAQTLQRVDQTLAMPRAEGQPWRVPEPHKPVMRKTTVTPLPASPAASRTWTWRQIDKAVDAMIGGTARFVSQQLLSQRLRMVEAERRITELEAKIEELTR